MSSGGFMLVLCCMPSSKLPSFPPCLYYLSYSHIREQFSDFCIQTLYVHLFYSSSHFHRLTYLFVTDVSPSLSLLKFPIGTSPWFTSIYWGSKKISPLCSCGQQLTPSIPHCRSDFHQILWAAASQISGGLFNARQMEHSSQLYCVMRFCHHPFDAGTL